MHVDQFPISYWDSIQRFRPMAVDIVVIQCRIYGPLYSQVVSIMLWPIGVIHIVTAGGQQKRPGGPIGRRDCGYSAGAFVRDSRRSKLILIK